MADCECGNNCPPCEECELPECECECELEEEEVVLADEEDR